MSYAELTDYLKDIGINGWGDHTELRGGTAALDHAVERLSGAFSRTSDAINSLVGVLSPPAGMEWRKSPLGVMVLSVAASGNLQGKPPANWWQRLWW